MEFLQNKRDQFKQSVIDRANRDIKKDHLYNSGDLVLIFVPVRPKAGSKKLSAYRWHGPHAIESKHGPATYIIKLLHSDSDLSRYRVVNQSRLKPFKDEEGITQVKQFLSKDIAPKQQTKEMLESFDSVTLNPETLDESLGRYGEVEINGRKVVLLPTGLSLPHEDVKEGVFGPHTYQWAWEPGEGSIIDEDRGPDRDVWITDKPGVGSPQPDPGTGTLADAFIKSLKQKPTVENREFDERDEDDPVLAHSRIMTPVGCTAIVVAEDQSIKQLAKKYGMSPTKLMGANQPNPCWKPLSSAAGRTTHFGDRMVKMGWVVWIPDAHFSSSEKKEVVTYSAVDAILGERRVNGIKEYLVKWEPTTKKGKKGVEITEFWDDSWESEEKMNCPLKIQEFEDTRASSIGMGGMH